MVSEAKLYLDRAEDEILLSKIDLELSTNNKTKEFFGIPVEKTFYYSVISQLFQQSQIRLLS